MSIFAATPSYATLQYRYDMGQIDENIQYDFFIALRDDMVGCEVTMFSEGEVYFGAVFDASGDAVTSEWMNWSVDEENRIIEADIAGELDFEFASENPDFVGREVLLLVEHCK